MMRKALFILSGNAAASLLLLARNLIVARMISVSDYGIASTFAMAMAIVEMASSLGLQQQIVQAKEGEDPRFQAALQGFQVLRGLISSVVLFVIAEPLARFLDIAEVAWAYQILAVVPLLNALQHFDIHRLNRQMRFGPLLLTGTLPSAAALAMTWPLAAWFGDWQVMLWSLLAQAVLGVVISQILAERPYRLAFDPTIMANSLHFGWPLLINAGLMFLVFQGDKLIVGRVLGMETLAVFSMGVTLTVTPTLVLAKSAQNLFLPRLSRLAPGDGFSRTALQTLQVVSLSSLLFVLLVLLLGGPVLTLLLGQKYASLAPLLAWFALGQGLRVMKAGPAIVALARGQTANAMAANWLRVMSLPLAWWAVGQGGGILSVLGIALAGEGAGLVVSIWLLLRRSDLPVRRVVLQQSAVTAVLFAIALLIWQTPPTEAVASWPIWAAAALAFALVCALMPETLQYFRHKRQA